MALKQLVTSDITSCLRWNVGHACKWVLMFDINRVPNFDVGRVLFWRVPPLMLRALVGWLTAAILLAVTETWTAQHGWRLPDRAALLVMVLSISTWCGLSRAIHQRRAARNT